MDLLPQCPNARKTRPGILYGQDMKGYRMILRDSEASHTCLDSYTGATSISDLAPRPFFQHDEWSSSLRIHYRVISEGVVYASNQSSYRTHCSSSLLRRGPLLPSIPSDMFFSQGSLPAKEA